MQLLTELGSFNSHLPPTMTAYYIVFMKWNLISVPSDNKVHFYCFMYLLFNSQVGLLRHQVEDMEKAQQDMVREYEQQLKKFQEEVSCKNRRLGFRS